MRILNRNEVLEVVATLTGAQLLKSIEEAFVAYSSGIATVPPIGHLPLVDAPGDVHIKYGYIKGDKNYVIKIGSGFHHNPQLNIPSSNGMMLAFDAKTGVPTNLLLDEGLLTELRTAVAGSVCAKWFGPKKVKRIGIIGTGIQARYQLELLPFITDCREAIVFGRSEASLIQYKKDMEAKGFAVFTTLNPSEVVRTSNLVVTTTPAKGPLFSVDDVQPGTHITAMGADTPGKQEIDPLILQKANHVFCDSLSQCLQQGEIANAVANSIISQDKIVEIGTAIQAGFQREENDITVADLTGVATQDIKITSLIIDNLPEHE